MTGAGGSRRKPCLAQHRSQAARRSFCSGAGRKPVPAMGTGSVPPGRRTSTGLPAMRADETRWAASSRPCQGGGRRGPPPPAAPGGRRRPPGGAPPGWPPLRGRGRTGSGPPPPPRRAGAGRPDQDGSGRARRAACPSFPGRKIEPGAAGAENQGRLRSRFQGEPARWTGPKPHEGWGRPAGRRKRPPRLRAGGPVWSRRHTPAPGGTGRSPPPPLPPPKSGPAAKGGVTERMPKISF